MSDAIVRASDALAPEEWQALRESARAIVRSGFLPRAISTPEKAVTLMLAGRELGLGPMQSIRAIHVIDGKPVMSADLMAGLVHRRIPGALLRVVETTDERCVVDAGRPGQQPTRFTFALADAQRAGLVAKENWRRYPRAMLRARCLSEAARAVFPDVLLGVYDPDELGAVTDDAGEIVVMPVHAAEQSRPAEQEPQRDQLVGGLLASIGDASSATELDEAKSCAREVWHSLSRSTRATVAAAIAAAEARLAGASAEVEREPGED